MKNVHVVNALVALLASWVLLVPTARAATPAECRPVPPAPCVCSEGPCCDGCQYLDAGVRCADDVEELGCAPGPGVCDAEILRRTAARFCSGESAACDGALGEFGAWEVLGRCGADMVCTTQRPLCRPAAACTCLVRCDDQDPCTVDSCDGEGGCVHEPVACDDGLACTPDRCDGGVCVHGAPDCDDDNPCTFDVCEEAGCRYVVLEDEPCFLPGGIRGVCWDGVCCVPDCEGRECGFDGCGGSCGSCDDGDACTLEECLDGTCERRPACDDEIACTYDVCLTGGYCFHTPDDATCDDGRACSEDVCSPDEGCVHDEAACVCADDAVEDNDTRATAKEVHPGQPVTDLQAVYGDDDWWWLDIDAGSALRVEVRTGGSRDLAADLDLVVRWDCGEVLDVAIEGDSLVAFGRSTFASPAVIQVHPRAAGLCLDYELIVTVEPTDFPEVFCNVKCPYLHGYEVSCNAQNHCEYTRPDAGGWQVADVLIWVPPSSFPFGPDDSKIVTFEHGYWVDKYEVTGGAYAAFLDEYGSNRCWVDWHGMAVGCLNYCSNNYWGHAHHSPDLTGALSCRVAWDEELGEAWIPAYCRNEPGGPLTTCRDHPVGDVTWFGAREYCRWRGADLCSEAQWERAGKGTTQQAFPWGDEPAPGTPEWDPELASVQDGPAYEVSPEFSMSRGASPVGCHHMAGNVAEWVLDMGLRDVELALPTDVPRDGSAWLGGDPDIRVIRGIPDGPNPFMNRGVPSVWQITNSEPPVFDWNVQATADHEFGFRCCRTRKCMAGEEGR